MAEFDELMKGLQEHGEELAALRRQMADYDSASEVVTGEAYEALAEQAEALAHEARERAAKQDLRATYERMAELELQRDKLLEEAAGLEEQYQQAEAERLHLLQEHGVRDPDSVKLRQRDLRHRMSDRKRRAAGLDREVAELRSKLPGLP